jgi:hypothetical protein
MMRTQDFDGAGVLGFVFRIESCEMPSADWRSLRAGPSQFDWLIGFGYRHLLDIPISFISCDMMA